MRGFSKLSTPQASGVASSDLQDITMLSAVSNENTKFGHPEVQKKMKKPLLKKNR